MSVSKEFKLLFNIALMVKKPCVLVASFPVLYLNEIKCYNLFMRISGKWINIAVLVAFVVSTMPFATHAMVMQDMQADEQIDATDCPAHTQEPVQDNHHHDKENTVSVHDCECPGISCNSSLLSVLILFSNPDYNLKSGFPVVAEDVKAAYLNRLERPPPLNP